MVASLYLMPLYDFEPYGRTVRLQAGRLPSFRLVRGGAFTPLLTLGLAAMADESHGQFAPDNGGVAMQAVGIPQTHLSPDSITRR